MNTSIKYGVALLLGCVSYQSQAQQKPDTTLKSTTIEIIQTYQPKVTQTPKPSLQAELPPLPPDVPEQQYSIPDYPLNFSYRAEPLVPLKLQTDSTRPLPFQNYGKVGVGNLGTFLLDIGLGQFQGENYESAIRVSHLSQKGSALLAQNIAKTSVDLNGKLHTATKIWDAQINFKRNRNFYYGYNQEVDTLSKKSIQQTYVGFAAGLGLANKVVDSSDWQWQVRGLADRYVSAKKSNEFSIDLDAPVRKMIAADLYLITGAHLSFTQYKNHITQSNNWLSAVAGLQYIHPKFQVKGFIQPGLAQGGKFYLLPNLDFRYVPEQVDVLLRFGLSNRLIKNTFQQLSTTNPFVSDSLITKPTQQTKIYAEAGTTILKHLSLLAGISWFQQNNNAMFVNSGLYNNEFSIWYDTAKVQGFQISIAGRYQFADKITIGISNEIYRFTNHSYKKVWHTPGWIMRATGQYEIIKGLQLNAYTAILNEIFAPDPVAISGYKKVNGVFDMGIGAELTLIDRLNIWVNVHNITGRKNEEWAGYRQYGLNVLGGLRVKF